MPAAEGTAAAVGATEGSHKKTAEAAKPTPSANVVSATSSSAAGPSERASGAMNWKAWDRVVEWHSDSGRAALIIHYWPLRRICKALRTANLEKIELKGNAVTDQAATAVLKDLTAIKSLVICDCDKVTDSTLQVAAERFPALDALYLDRRPSRIKARNGYNGNHQVKFTDAGLQQVASKCGELRTFKLNWCRGITDEGVRAIARGCSKLEVIDIGWCRITDASIVAVSESCAALRVLELRTCRQVSDEGLTVLASKCLSLQRLSITDCGMTDKGLLALLGHCRHLQHIHLSDCDGITEKGFLQMAKLVDGIPLTVLNLSHCTGATDEVLDVLASFASRLKELTLNWVKISDKALCTVTKKVLDIDGCRDVTDATLEALGQGPAGKGLPNLREVSTFNCKVTQTGIEALKKRCPKVNASNRPWP